MDSEKQVILVVDDDILVRVTVGIFLEMDGFEVIQAGDGLEALEVLRQRAAAVRLVVTDLEMPRLGGRQLVAEMVRHWPCIPAIAMTGGSPADLDFPVLAKPFDLQTLAGRVRRELESSPRRECREEQRIPA